MYYLIRKLIIFEFLYGNFRSMTWAQLIFAIIALSIKVSINATMFIHLIIFTFFRFCYYLMTSDRDEFEVEQAALPMPERYYYVLYVTFMVCLIKLKLIIKRSDLSCSSHVQYASPVWSAFQQCQHPCNYDVFGVRLPSFPQTSQATPQGQPKTEGFCLLNFVIN